MKACPSYPKLFQTRALSGGQKNQEITSKHKTYLDCTVGLRKKKCMC